MTEAPERIWLLPFDGEQRCWCDDPDPSGLGHDADATGYVRADLCAAQPDTEASIIAERDELRAQLATAEADALERVHDRIQRIADGYAAGYLTAGNVRALKGESA